MLPELVQLAHKMSEDQLKAGANFCYSAFKENHLLIEQLFSLTAEKIPNFSLKLKCFHSTIKMKEYKRWTRLTGIFDFMRIAAKSHLLEHKLYVPEETYNLLIIIVVVPHMLGRAYRCGKFMVRLSNAPLENFLFCPSKNIKVSSGLLTRFLGIMERIKIQQVSGWFRQKVEEIIPRSFSEKQGKCLDFHVTRAHSGKKENLTLLHKNLKVMTHSNCGAVDVPCTDFFLRFLNAHNNNPRITFMLSAHAGCLMQRGSGPRAASGGQVACLGQYNIFKNDATQCLVTCLKVKGLWHLAIFERRTSTIHYSNSLSLCQNVGKSIGSDDCSELKLFLNNFISLLTEWRCQAQKAENCAPITAKKFVMTSQSLKHTRNKSLIPGNFADLSGVHCLKLCFDALDNPQVLSSPLHIPPFGDSDAINFHILLLKILQRLIIKHGKGPAREQLTSCGFDEDENTLVYKFSLDV